jgi:low affinity Fe/Cu permease
MKKNEPKGRIGLAMERFSQGATRWSGSTLAFILALLTIVIWLISGPVFKFSDTWQLVINTGTTIITFLMVFLIQRAQNKEALSIQLKLNEIVAAMKGASNRLVDIEALSESELRTLHDHYQQLATLSKAQHDLFSSHSVDEAQRRHQRKTEEWDKAG